jgi:two-component system chemotaxis response regulator CheY
MKLNQTGDQNMFPPETKILIADDMPALRELLKNQLKKMGFKNFTEANDGSEALQVLIDAYKSGNPFELVISDWNMPNMSGIDFLKKFRSSDQLKSVPFVLLTTESEREQVTEAIMAGVSQYMIKPFSPKLIDEKLRSAYQKHFAKKTA